jgi:hypothetical protein
VEKGMQKENVINARLVVEYILKNDRIWIKE